MRGFTDRPKSLAHPITATNKGSFTNDDTITQSKPSQVRSDAGEPAAASTSSMRRVGTNESLAGLEIEALGSAPPPSAPHLDEWAHKQLMGMVNRSADGRCVVGDDDDSSDTPPPLRRSSAFSHHGKARSVIAGFDSVPNPILGQVTNSLTQSQQLAPTTTHTASSQPRTLISSSSTSALPIGNLRREAKSSAFENRLRLKREKDQHMARMIVEEEHKKMKDKERLREIEERMKAKVAREHQEHQDYDPNDKQPHPSSSPHNPSDDNFAYFRSMRKKIKDINVKPTLPSIGLDEKLKKLNTRVKGFLSTNQPSFSLPIQKFRDKRNSKHVGRNMPIKLNIVDDFMKDLELQRMAEESSQDGLSPMMPRTDYDIHSSANSSPSEVQQKQIRRARKRLAELRLANKSTSELQLLVRALSQDMQANNDAIVAAQRQCAKIRAEMERTKTIFTVDIDTTCNKITKASTLGTQFVTTVREIRTQLDTTRSATASCSDQIKQLEVHVQKVQRAKKPTDKLVRYLFWLPLSILLLYLIIKSPTCQMLVVLSVFIWVLRTVRGQNSAAAELANFQETAPAQYDDLAEDYDPEDIIGTQSPETITSACSPIFPNSDPSSPVTSSSSSSIRRNHSDLVLQSLLGEEEFAEAQPHESPRLRTVVEDDLVGISPKSRNKSNNQLGGGKTENTEPTKVGTSTSRSSGNALRGPLRTSATSKDSVAMNLALHNLNQMSLKIQQMQQGK